MNNFLASIITISTVHQQVIVSMLDAILAITAAIGFSVMVFVAFKALREYRKWRNDE